MAKRILNRKDLRADFDAAERRKQDDEVDEAEEEGEEDAEDEEEEGEEEAEEEAAVAGEDEEPEEEAPPPKKKAAPKKKPAKPRTRTRTPKITRMKVVWGVFSNSNQRVATFDFPKRKEADDLAAKLSNDKKSTHFVQPIKEPIEEKKDEETSPAKK